MPLLPLEPFLHPQTLLADDDQAEPAGDDLRWWVLHTRPRAEKSLARRLLDRDIPFFLPLYERHWRGRGRMLHSYLPLFPGYLFLFGDYQTRLHSLETNLVAQCLPVGDQDQLSTDLRRIHGLMKTGEALAPEARLLPGTSVEIVKGPLAGLQGTILRRDRRLRLVVSVQFLQRGASVEIESWMIRSVESKQLARVASAHS